MCRARTVWDHNAPLLYLKCRGPERSLGDSSAFPGACEMLRRPSEERLMRMREGLGMALGCLSALSGELGSEVPAGAQVE